MTSSLPSNQGFWAAFSRLKISLGCCIALFSGISGLRAQNVANYVFSQTQSTYADLDNPTSIAVPTALTGTGSVDDQVYTLAANTIPFNFTFNGTAYTGLNVYANGYVSFGTTITNANIPISSISTYAGVVAAMAGDLHALYNINGLTGSLSYQTVGSAPNREFVIEWKHFRPYVSSSSATSYFDWNFQIRLRENNTVGIAYNCFVTGTPSSYTAQAGLRGATNADYATRSATGTAASNWSSTTAGTTSGATVTTNSTSLPQNGLTFNWDAPAACVAPTAQPTNLALANTGIVINGSFTAANPAADRYLVLRNLAGTTPNLPANGTTYATGDNASLNAYVAYYGSATAFENNYNNGIRGNNTYVYTIYSANSVCTGGPLYFTQNPLSGSITNCLQAPGTLTIGAATTTSITLNWAASENGNANPYDTVIEVATDGNFANPITGSPFTVASGTLTLTANGLSANTQYFFRVKYVGTTCQSAYSTSVSSYTACVPVTAFYENFDGISSGTNLPNCWSKIISPATGSSVPTINVSSTDASSTPNNVSFYGNGADTDASATKIIAVSPQVTNLSAGTHRLRFKARKTSTSTTSLTGVQIVALDGNSATANATVIETFSNLTTSYQEYVAYFTNYSGNGNYIGIQRISGTSYSYLYIDDVIWEPIPSCPELTATSVTNATYQGGTLNWTNPDNVAPAAGYEYMVTTANAVPSETSAFTSIASTATSQQISGLASGTTYYVWTRRLCTADDKSPWSVASFATVPVTPAPWTESFATTTIPTGWATTGWTVGATAGSNGNPGTNIYKNLYGSAATGTFSTIAIGPLNNANFELSFDYRQGAYSSPYTPLTDWGNYEVQVSTDFGATWTTIATIANEGGTGAYIHKNYPLSAYQGQYVKVRVNATRTAGDYYLSFDNFKIDVPELGTGDFGKRDLSLYPNPTNGVFTVQASQPIKEVKICNAIGQVIAQQKENQFDLTAQPSGLYIVTVDFGDGIVEVRKVVRK